MNTGEWFVPGVPGDISILANISAVNAVMSFLRYLEEIKTCRDVPIFRARQLNCCLVYCGSAGSHDQLRAWNWSPKWQSRT